jgi:hypothetical protein
MSLTIKDSCAVKYTDQNIFGNDWGFYVDIENVKPNLPKNNELIRKKYTTPVLNEKYDKNYYDTILLEEIANEDETQINFIVKIGTNAIIIMLITYTILKIL